MLDRYLVKDQVYDLIREKILRGEYPLGGPINIAQLTAELGASNTPIREALSKLESDMLIVKNGSRHYVVTISDEANSELDETVSFIVVGGMDICIKKDRLEELTTALREAFDAQSALLGCEDYYAYMCAVINFDRTFVRVSGNALLLSLFEEVSTLLTLVVANKHRGRTTANYYEHREILTAIEGGDLPEARRLIIAHYDKPLSRFPADE